MTEVTVKIALVTGANKGIGFATARQLAQSGITVLLGARDKARGLKAAEMLGREGLQVRCVALNVTDQRSIDAAVAGVEHDFGHLDILVNNPGIGPDGRSASKFEVETIRAPLDTNFLRHICGAQELPAVKMPLVATRQRERLRELQARLP